jgi:hypothetical protein
VDKSFVVDCDAMPAQRGDGAFEVDGVPKNDGSDNEVETTRPVALVLETAVTQVALPVEEHSAGESVSGFVLIESDLDSPAQLRVFHPLQHKECALDAADFAQRSVEAVLTGIAGELTDDERSSHRAVPDGCGESEDFVPLCSDQFEVELAADQRCERWMVALLARDIEPLVSKIADAGRKAKSQQMAQRKEPMPEVVTWKLYRAKQHFDELAKELLEYFRNGPGELVEAPESAPENQILGYKLKGDVPARFGLIAGDFLQNMRSSLDYLVWQLAIANKRKPGTCNAFPICLTLEGWEKSLHKHDRLRGVHSDAVAEIKALQPCFTNSPNPLPLTVLETLTNHNKHRNPLTTGAVMLLTPAVKLPIGCAEFQVSRMVKGQMVDGERFIAYVAFKEEIVKGLEILATLEVISNVIGFEVLPKFERFF